MHWVCERPTTKYGDRQIFRRQNIQYIYLQNQLISLDTFFIFAVTNILLITPVYYVSLKMNTAYRG